MDRAITIITVHSELAMPGIGGVLTPSLIDTISQATGLSAAQIYHELSLLEAREIISIERHTVH